MRLGGTGAFIDASEDEEDRRISVLWKMDDDDDMMVQLLLFIVSISTSVAFLAITVHWLRVMIIFCASFCMG